MGFFYLIATVLLMVYSQLIIKWRISKSVYLPPDLYNKILYLIKLLLDPFVMSGFITAFLASLFWMLAMTKFELSQAYPMLIGGLAILTSFFAIIIFNESFGIMKATGLLLIIGGIYFLNRG